MDFFKNAYMFEEFKEEKYHTLFTKNINENNTLL